MNGRTGTHRALALCVSLVLASFTAGCSAGAHAAASGPPAAGSAIYLAQVTCWNTMSCCIQSFPLTAAESCGATAVEIAEVFQGAKLLHASIQSEEERRKEEAQAQEDAKAADAAEAEGEAAPEPPDCQGQNHHVISRPIAKKLKDHDTLGGLYEPRDERFVARAKDRESHCGYQNWHREVDREVIQWLRDFPKATRKEFESFLREIYNRPEMRQRFPHGF
jgi:hypothetical protein